MPDLTIKGMNNGNSGSPIYQFPLPAVFTSEVWAKALNGIISIPGDAQIWKKLTEEKLKQAAADLPFHTIISKFSEAIKELEEIPAEYRWPLILSTISLAFTESNFNGRAISEVRAKITDYAQASKIYASKAKGYFQLLPGTFTWMANTYNRAGSTIREILDKVDVLSTIKTFSPDEADTIEEVGHPLKMDLTEPASQIIPSLSYVLHDAAQVFRDWQWDETKQSWTPKVPFGNPGILTQVNNLVPGALQDKELGLQLFMTIYHVNGIGCLHQKNRQTFAYKGVTNRDNRYATDVANYLSLKQIISPETIADLFNI